MAFQANAFQTASPLQAFQTAVPAQINRILAKLDRIMQAGASGESIKQTSGASETVSISGISRESIG